MKFRIFFFILVVTVKGHQGHRYHAFDEDNDLDKWKTTLNDIVTQLETYDDESDIDDAEYIFKEIKWLIFADLEIQLKEIIENAGVDLSLARHCNTAKTVAVAKIESKINKEIEIAAIYVIEANNGSSDKSVSLIHALLNIWKDIKTLVENCVADNKTNPLGCVHEQIMAKITSLLDNMRYLADTYITSVDSVIAWTTKIQDTFASKKNAIITDYKKCVNQLKK